MTEITTNVAMEPSIRSTVVDGQLVQTGQIWRRKKDGKRVEIVWMTDWRGVGVRIQLRPAGATNLKITHWIDRGNLPLLYEKAADRP